MDLKIDLPEGVKKIIDILSKNGYEAFVVGGCVRDSIIGIKPNDWDITTSAKPDEIMSCFREYKIIPTGLKHGTVTVIIDGEQYEITTYRIDGKYSDGRHPDAVIFTSDLAEDLSRRDFTINAIAYNPEKGLIDPFGGAEDIKNGLIRCVGNPKDRFEEDALRMLRAIRFSSQLDFTITTKTEIGIIKIYRNLEKISIERIADEFKKIAVSNKFYVNLVIYDYVFSSFIPEYKDIFNFEQNNPYHKYNLYMHTNCAVENCKSTDLITKLAVFFHDFGKPHSYQDDENGIRHFYGHAKVSGDITDKILKRLKFDNYTREKIVELVKYHDATIVVNKKYIKRWLNKIGEEQFIRLLDVQEADAKAHHELYIDEKVSNINKIRILLRQVIDEKECFSLKDLAINGNDIKKYMMLEEGHAVGLLLREILQMVIDGKLNNKKEEIIKWMTKMTDLDKEIK